jgi:hypothetical protein
LNGHSINFATLLGYNSETISECRAAFGTRLPKSTRKLSGPLDDGSAAGASRRKHKASALSDLPASLFLVSLKLGLPCQNPDADASDSLRSCSHY